MALHACIGYHMKECYRFIISLKRGLINRKFDIVINYKVATCMMLCCIACITRNYNTYYGMHIAMHA